MLENQLGCYSLALLPLYRGNVLPRYLVICQQKQLVLNRLELNLVEGQHEPSKNSLNFGPHPDHLL